MHAGLYLCLMSSVGWHGLAALVAQPLLATGCSAQCAEELAHAPPAAMPALFSLLSALLPGLPTADHQCQAAQAVLAALKVHSPGLAGVHDQLRCLLALSSICRNLEILILGLPVINTPAASQQTDTSMESSGGSSHLQAVINVDHIARKAFALLAELLRVFQRALQNPGMALTLQAEPADA